MSLSQSNWRCWSDGSCNGLAKKLVSADFDSPRYVIYCWFVLVSSSHVSLGNKIGDAGVTALATALGQNSTLQTLKLSGTCMIYFHCLFHSSQVLVRKSQWIRRSDGSCSRLGAQLGTAELESLLYACLCQSGSCCSCFLSGTGNRIGVAGVIALATVLERNSTLQTFDLTGMWFISIIWFFLAHVFLSQEIALMMLERLLLR